MAREHPLGRLDPLDYNHVSLFGLAALPVPLPIPPPNSSRILNPVLPRTSYNQGSLNGCVGASTSRVVTMDNSTKGHTRIYDWRWLWGAAKARDGYPDPQSNRGTTVRAALEVLKAQGHKLAGAKQPDPAQGISEFRWARSVDEMRAALFAGLPLVIGIGWWPAFDRPEQVGGDYFIGRGDAWHNVNSEGGHALCLWGFDDRRGAFRFCNTWGSSFPLAWLTYSMMEYQFARGGEAGCVTDKVGP